MKPTLEQRMAMIENRQRKLAFDYQTGRLMILAMVRVLERLSAGAGEQVLEIAERMRQLAESENRATDVAAIDSLIYQLDQELRSPAND